MIFACQKLAPNEEENFTSTTCNRQGKRDPDPAEFCAITLGKQPQFVIVITAYVVHKKYEIYSRLGIYWQRSKTLTHSIDHIKGLYIIIL